MLLSVLGEDRATTVLQKIQKQMDSTSQSAKQSADKTGKSTRALGQLTDRFDGMAAKLGKMRMAFAALAASLASGAIVKAASGGAVLEAQLARIGGTAEEGHKQLKKMAAAAGGVFSVQDLVDFQTRQNELGAQLGLTGEELGKLDSRFTALGKSGGDGLRLLIEAVATGRTVALKQLGLVTDLTAGYDAYAVSINKTTAQLTEQDKVRARVAVLREDIKGINTESGNSVTAFEQAGAAMSDAWTEVQLALAPIGRILLPIAKIMGKIAHIAGAVLGPVLDTVADAVDVLSGTHVTAAEKTKEHAQEIRELGHAAVVASASLSVLQTSLGLERQAEVASLQQQIRTYQLRAKLQEDGLTKEQKLRLDFLQARRRELELSMGLADVEAKKKKQLAELAEVHKGYVADNSAWLANNKDAREATDRWYTKSVGKITNSARIQAASLQRAIKLQATLDTIEETGSKRKDKERKAEAAAPHQKRMGPNVIDLGRAANIVNLNAELALLKATTEAERASITLRREQVQIQLDMAAGSISNQEATLRLSLAQEQYNQRLEQMRETGAAAQIAEVERNLSSLDNIARIAPGGLGAVAAGLKDLTGMGLRLRSGQAAVNEAMAQSGQVFAGVAAAFGASKETQALIAGAFEFAAGWGAIGAGNPVAAAAHFTSAGLYGAIAGGVGGAAAGGASPAFAPGGQFPSFRGSSGGQQPSQIVINFNGPVGDKQGTARELRRVLETTQGTGLMS
jgi:hypothetical protein